MSVLSAGSSYYYLTLFVSFAIKRDTKQRSKIKGEIIVNVYINNKTVAESNDIYKRKSLRENKHLSKMPKRKKWLYFKKVYTIWDTISFIKMGKMVTACFLSVTSANYYCNLTWRLTEIILTRLCVVFVQYIINHYM